MQNFAKVLDVNFKEIHITNLQKLKLKSVQICYVLNANKSNNLTFYPWKFVLHLLYSILYIVLIDHVD